MHRRPKVLVVGSGISGLSSAWHLRHAADVEVFESESRLGGHTHTHEIEVDGIPGTVDTGFIVFNERTYPEFQPWLQHLGVDIHLADMSFSVSAQGGSFEWAGHSIRGLFAQPKNLTSPRFWRMLADVLRFNLEAPSHLAQIERGERADSTLASYLRERGYSETFESGYLLPMGGAIWSCPPSQMRSFPFQSFTRFFVNHGLLQLMNRPLWFSLRGGSKCYVARLRSLLETERASVCFRTRHHVQSVSGLSDGGVRLRGVDQATKQVFERTADAVVLAGHTNQNAAILASSAHPAWPHLNAFRYESNSVYLHRDTTLMPRRRAAWAAWNYRAESGSSDSLSVTYWMNQLQDLPFQSPVLVSLNPATPPREDLTLQTLRYEHPVYDESAFRGRAAALALQGEQRVWFAGAWTGYGFHEDGFRSGRLAAESLLQALDVVAPSACKTA